MNIVRLTSILLLLLAATRFNPAEAEQNDHCPKRLGMVSNNMMATTTAKVVTDIYQKLGCPVEMVILPARRGFAAFNEGEIDGELFRAPIGSTHYTRAHVRSEQPMFETSQSLWAAPGTELQADLPVGYLIGIAWQEYYLDRTGLPKSGHLHIADMISHYNNGTITRFLAEDSNTKSAIEHGDFPADRIPVQVETVAIDPLYHFLGAEFADFMARFSEYVKTHHPFTRANAM